MLDHLIDAGSELMHSPSVTRPASSTRGDGQPPARGRLRTAATDTSLTRSWSRQPTEPHGSEATVGIGIEGQDNLHPIRANCRRYGIAVLNFLGIHGDSIAPLEKLGSVPVESEVIRGSRN
jgi:hypothetical protein